MSDVALKYQNESLLPWQLRGIWNFQKKIYFSRNTNCCCPLKELVMSNFDGDFN